VCWFVGGGLGRLWGTKSISLVVFYTLAAHEKGVHRLKILMPIANRDGHEDGPRAVRERCKLRRNPGALVA
jgi:hypothetical protein